MILLLVCTATHKLPAQPSQDLAKRFMKAWFETAKELKARRCGDSSPAQLAIEIIAKSSYIGFEGFLGRGLNPAESAL